MNILLIDDEPLTLQMLQKKSPGRRLELIRYILPMTHVLQGSCFRPFPFSSWFVTLKCQGKMAWTF